MTERQRKVIIVDDEPAARSALRSVIGDFPSLEIVADIQDGKAAVNAIEELAPDIVFLDIDMPGIDGLEVAKRTQHLSYHLVFVTAHHKYALEAFSTNATDFLLKPARPSLINKCIEKILRQEALALQKIKSGDSGRGSLILEESGLSRVVNEEHIVLIDTIGRYRRIVLSGLGRTAHGQETLVTNVSFEELSERLDEAYFLRIHRSCIVNVTRVTAVKLRNRRHFVEVGGFDGELPVARSQVKQLKANLKSLSAGAVLFSQRF